jgi:2-polyprenyl-3-methyl-5-hydroxy-6-metoxy-1,4-benzoquinol methylase
MLNLKKRYFYNNDISENIIKLIKFTKKYGKNYKLLDVGCGSGYQSNFIRKKFKFEVHGIEEIKSLKEKLNKNLDKAILENLNDKKKISKIIKSNYYDYIIFSDVLEHIVDPVDILNFYKKFLKKNGFIIVSVPNVANIYQRLLLLFGFFSYQEAGVMDKTHLRFFTKKTLISCAKEANLKIVHNTSDSIIIRGLFYIFRLNSLKNTKNLTKSVYMKVYKLFIQPLELIFVKLLPNIFSFRFGLLLKK